MEQKCTNVCVWSEGQKNGPHYFPIPILYSKLLEWSIKTQPSLMSVFKSSSSSQWFMDVYVKTKHYKHEKSFSNKIFVLTSKSAIIFSINKIHSSQILNKWMNEKILYKFLINDSRFQTLRKWILKKLWQIRHTFKLSKNSKYLFSKKKLFIFTCNTKYFKWVVSIPSEDKRRLSE